MSAALIAILCTTMLATSFLSGVFGMAGGMILIGVLLAIMPLPEAMALHAVTQMASNGWRALLWLKYVMWRATVFYLIGFAVAMLIWSFTRYVPSKAVALLLLGTTPFLVRLMPASLRPDPLNPAQGVIYGMICATLLLLTGVTGPLLDTFFLGGDTDRRQKIATKGICQLLGHGAKLFYFSSVIDQAASVDPIIAGLAITATVIGTTAASGVLNRMTDTQFRVWSNHIITGVSGYFVVYGGYVLAVSGAK
jgi:uncharacterized membrane protein YfcA